jgi:hypothetical protein
MSKKTANKKASKKQPKAAPASKRPARTTPTAVEAKQEHELPSAKEVANTPRRPVAGPRGPKAKAKAKADGKPRASRTGKPETRPRRPSGLDLAAKALASSKEPLNAKEIAERVLAMGWSTSGKTPHATLYAAIIREIAAKGKDARFRKAERGLFAATPAGKGA